MRVYKAEGIVIKRRNVGEADKIITVFTAHFGKIQAKAVGVRRIPSRRAAHVELLNHSSFTLHRGKALPIVTQAYTIENFNELKEDLVKVGFAYHICELIDGLCPDNQENKTVFDLLKSTLSELCFEQKNIAPIIHNFEVELLYHLGFYPRNQSFQNFNSAVFIESILERKLKSRRFLLKLSQ